MTDLDRDVLAAKAMGISYGQYKAINYTEPPARATNRRKKQPKTYDEHQVFSLWKAGKTDAEIASVVGVSRTIIQRWRDEVELPSVARTSNVDTKKYRLEHLRDGTIIAIKDEDL